MPYRNYPASELAKACANADNAVAWAEFIRRFQPLIAGATLRTARMWGEISAPHLDDLVQETYLKLCQDKCRLLRSFESTHEDCIFGFLKVLAANVVHDHFKAAFAAKRGAGVSSLPSTDLETVPDSDDSFVVVAQRIQLERIERILHQVTSGKDQEKKRAIFWLRHRQGFSASEIAALPAMGLTTEGVESVLFRLSEMIRNHLSGTQPHREVRAFKRHNRSKDQGN